MRGCTEREQPEDDVNIQETELAAVDSARAYQTDDVVIVQIAGQRPSACHLVTVERSGTNPAEFVARMATDPRARCMPTPTAFDVAAAFRTASAIDSVRVLHAGGEVTAPVTALVPAASERSAGPVVVDFETGPDEAVGYSNSWDLGEALRDAIANMGPGNPGADWLHQYTISELGAEVGGIAGFHHLRVRVRRS